MKKLISVLLVMMLLVGSVPFCSVAENDVTDEITAVPEAGEENDVTEEEDPSEPGTVIFITEDPEDEDPDEPAAADEEPGDEDPEEPAAGDEDPADEDPEEPAAAGEDPVAEEPAAEEPAAEEPAAEEPAEEDPVHFEQGYIRVKKGTSIYAAASKQEVCGSFAEDAIVYAESEAKRDDPAKDWLKIYFAVEADGQESVVTGYIQAKSMKELTADETEQLLEKLDQDTRAQEIRGYKLPVAAFERKAEEAVPAETGEPEEKTQEIDETEQLTEEAQESGETEEPAAEPVEEETPEMPATPPCPPQEEQDEEGLGDNKSALPTVKVSVYSFNGYIHGKASASNASGDVFYYWYTYDTAGNYYGMGNEKSVQFWANDYLNCKVYCVVNVNGLYISSPSYTVVASPEALPRYQNSKLGDVINFSCEGVPDDATASYQWQYSQDGGKSWKNLSGYTAKDITFKVTTAKLGNLYRCVATVNGTKAYSNSVYMIVAIASPDVASGKLNATAKFSVKCENATGDISYQWQYSNDKGATWLDATATGYNTKTIEMKVTVAATKRLYRCIVNSSTGSTISNNVKLKGIFCAVASPEKKAVNVGSTVKFKATPYFASGTVTYQWQYSTDGKTWKNASLSGYNTQTLKVKLTESRMPYRYRCAVTAGGKTVYTNTVMPFSAKATPKDTSAKLGDTVKLTATAYNASGSLKYQWQYSADQGKTWKNTKQPGYKTKKLSLTIEKASWINYLFRCKVTDKCGTVYTNSVKLNGTLSVSIKRGNTGLAVGKTAKFVTTVSFASGTVTYTWQYSKDGGKTWADSPVLKGANATITLKENQLTYLCRCVVKAKNGTATSNSIRLIDFTLAATKPVYRALLIGERNFDPYCARNGGDVVHMASMLGKVYGPGGTKYKVTKKFDLRWSEIRDAIRDTFADTKDTDVSLFMIASHGAVNVSSGERAGAISTMDWSLYFSELAEWFGQYCKGKVIVIIESCGAGSSIYASGVSENGSALENDADEKLVQSAVSAFASADPGITVETTETVINEDGEMVVNTGELRTSKYYVLAAARHMEVSYGLAETGSASTQADSGNVFIYGLVEGVGSSSSSPADKSPKNKVITLEESYSYCVTFARAWSKYLTQAGIDWDPGVDPSEAQHTQRYPKNSSYPLFIFP